MIATRSLGDWVPGVAQFRGYERGWLRGDVIAAGLTVTAYLVPQVMAYSTLAGLPAVTGLWAAIVALTVYVLIGSSRQLSMGPESTTALMTAAVLAPLAVGDSVRYGMLAAILAVLVGAVCFVGAVARLGFLANMLSRPVLVYDRHRDPHDRKPAGQDHRRTGFGR
jgi:SulP family sulfate permease